MAYSHQTWLQLKTSLLTRLGDSSFFTDNTSVLSEAHVYLQEAMRVWAATALWWRERVTFTLTQNVHWYDLAARVGTLSNTVTDSLLLGEIQYHLLEPLSLTSWTGSAQFTLAEITESMERRRNQLLLETGIVLSVNTLAVSSPPQGRVDTTSINPDPIEVRRVAWKSTAGVFSTLWRADEWEAEGLKPGWKQAPADPPEVYSVAVTPPLSLQLVPSPSANGSVEIISVLNGAVPNVSSGVSLGIPDNLAWIVKYGVMADLLGRESQSRDFARAKYCERRWREGVEIARRYTTVLQAEINGVNKFISSIHDMDTLAPSWQNTAAGTPTEVGIAGLNLIGVSPKPSAVSVSLTMDIVRPAPIPASDSATVQLGPEELNAIVDYAHHIAAFKQGGAEFQATERQYENLLRLANVHRERIAAVTKHLSPLQERTQREEDQRPRREARETKPETFTGFNIRRVN